MEVIFLNLRTGIGYDVHRLVANRKLIIGGVHIPYELGLLGHSDADVLTHAIMDALIGAMCKGDIGTLFPDTDDKYKNIDSLLLLKEVKNILNNEYFDIINIDCVIIAEKPKMMPYIKSMKQNLINVLQIKEDQINIKATTEEGLGFTGSCDGISSKVVCLIKKNI